MLSQRFIRWMDGNVGRPVCFLLTVQRKIFGLFRPKRAANDKPSKVMFIKLIEQGFTVLAYPALKMAVGIYGKENVYFMVFRENRIILDILDIVPRENVIEISSDGLLSFLISVPKALFRTRREKIDSAIDMEFYARGSVILSYLSGARHRVGLYLFTCEGPYRGDLLTHKLTYNPYLHTMTYYVSLLEALKYEPPRANVPLVFKIPEYDSTLKRYYPSPEEKLKLAEKTDGMSKGPLKKPIVILNPNAGDLLPIRKWKKDRFIRLGEMIINEYPVVTIIITGNERERAMAEAISGKIRGAVSLAGQLTLGELLALYSISDLLITNDSGPAHFSALTGIRSIVLFGPETPLIYAEKGANIHTLTPDFICSPCVNIFNHRRSACVNAKCMDSIRVEDVMRLVRRIL